MAFTSWVVGSQEIFELNSGWQVGKGILGREYSFNKGTKSKETYNALGSTVVSIPGMCHVSESVVRDEAVVREVVVTPASLSHLREIMTYAQQVGSNIDLLYCGKLALLYRFVKMKSISFMWAMPGCCSSEPGVGSGRKGKGKEPFTLPRVFPEALHSGRKPQDVFSNDLHRWGTPDPSAFPEPFSSEWPGSSRNVPEPASN